jgi:hypothetical protein
VIVPDGVPEVRVIGAVVKTNLLGTVAPTLMPAETAEVKVPEVKVRVTVPALVTYNPLNVATPLEGVDVWAVVVAFRFPPVVSLAVIAVE